MNLISVGPHRAPRPLRLVQDVFIVDPNPQTLTRLSSAIDPSASIITCRSFKQARTALHVYAPKLLVTNLRLDDFNGLHLVLLTASFGTRCVVYNSVPGADRGLASEIRRFAAFYETEANLLRALPAYLSSTLPDYDRRQIPSSDRRAFPRGGRRASDAVAHLRQRVSA